MPRKFSLNNPMDGHEPDVGRVKLGLSHRTGILRPVYGTTLRCSCGWRPKAEGRHTDCVSNDAPSRGGRQCANFAYQDHLASLRLYPKEP